MSHREGLSLFSRDVQERAEQILRAEKIFARHQRGESDDGYLQRKLNALSASYERMTRTGTHDRRALRTALESLTAACHDCAEAISDTEHTGG